ncbi:YggT family protein [Nitrosospira sp. Nsp5]|jgi:YggT family protein|uniref:YggT family protein n=1 Tax=Nitrosospira multiformis TaxID=1231 RepID=A0ABY0T9J8_9PROT|nr:MULTISPECIES: YggT family protein [Nitrosospira]PTR08099.1 YggT family protein [Nitrosospira sp. Nsp5]SCY17947.1 YggT family protein [Nitrosospira sp. Nsp13]SDQ49043.1 YggT family protein [Nitrosospira multiformis]
MLNQILIFLLDTLLGLFSLALLLRFYMQLLRAPYRNPLSQFLVALTDFIVRPARRVIPGYSGMDLSTLLLAWLAQCMLLTGVLMLQGYEFRSTIGIAITGLVLLGLIEIIKMTLYIILVAIIMQAVLSWFNPHTPLAPMLDSFTRPFLGVIRRRIPPIGNVDLSPLFVLVIIQLLLFVVAGAGKEISLLF